MGSYLTIVNNTQDTYYIQLGCDTAALKVGTAIGGAIAIVGSGGLLLGPVTGGLAAVGATTIGVGQAVANSKEKVGQAAVDQLTKDGFITLEPGEKKQYGKMSLSLWQQCICIRIRDVDDGFVFEQVIMRPIFSGPTDGSNNDHCIKGWAESNGHEQIYKYTF